MLQISLIRRIQRREAAKFMNEMNTDAQLKIQQMSFMLMAVFIFFMLVGLFYLVIQSQKWREEATLLEKNKAIELAKMLANSAEFSCGSGCIDADRALMLGKRTAYKNYWGVNSIEIRTIYPVNSKEVKCTEANYPSCNLINIFNKGAGESTASSYVSLCKRVNEKSYVYYKCEVAVLIVGYTVK